MRAWLSSVKSRLLPRRKFSSSEYWDRRYRRGGNSGPGSYNHLAAFKAEVLNAFVQEHDVRTVIEFGCGDGNQLELARYPEYVGYDVSPTAISLCLRRFDGRPGMEFLLASSYDGRQAELALSLDVIFHLTEDEVYETYMRRLFNASTRFVIILSSNQEEPVQPVSEHVRHREFTKWVEEEFHSGWALVKRVPNIYPYNGDFRTTSFADFYIFGKR